MRFALFPKILVGAIGLSAAAVCACAQINPATQIKWPSSCISGYVYSPFGNLCVVATGIPYPGAGVANSTGSSWGTSYQVGTSANNLLQLTGAGLIPSTAFLWPSAGVANSTGSAWGSSYQVGTGANDLVQLNPSGNLSIPGDIGGNSLVATGAQISNVANFSCIGGNSLGVLISGACIPYPGAGVPNSTGSSWGTSYQVGTSANDLLKLDASGNLSIPGDIGGTSVIGAGAQFSNLANDPCVGADSSGVLGACGGVVIYTSSTTGVLTDGSKLVIMNCTAACSYTLPTTQPSANWFTHVMSIGSTLATVVLSGGDTFNRGSTPPVLGSFQPFSIYANTATSTDYAGGGTILAGSNIAITPCSSGQGCTSIAFNSPTSFTINNNSCSLGGTCVATGFTVTYTANHTGNSVDNSKLVIMNCSSACIYTLPATQPASSWNTQIVSIGGTLATIALGGSDTFNGSLTPPILVTGQVLHVFANLSIATDYAGGT